MAVEEVKINFVADTSGLNSSVEKLVEIGKITEADAKKFNSLEAEIRAGMNDALKAAGVSAKQFGDALLKSTKGTDANFKSLRTQMLEARNAAAQAAEQFGETSQEFRDAAARAGELKARVDDLNDTLSALDPDAKAKAFTQFGNAAFGAFQIATGALQAFGIENERVNKLAQQFQGLLNITQGLSTLGQLGDSLKNIRTVLGLTTAAQTAANAASAASVPVNLAAAGALQTEAAAAGIATTANRAFAASLTATGIGAAVVLLGTLVAAMVALSEQTERAAKEAEKFNDIQDSLRQSTERLTEAQRQYRLLTGEITETQAAVEKLNEEFAKEAAPLVVKLKQTQVEIEATKNSITSLQDRIEALQSGRQTDATPSLIAAAQQQLRNQEALLDAQLRNEQSLSDDIGKLSQALTLQKKGEYEKDTQNRKKEQDDQLKAAQDAAAKEIALQRQLLVERQRLALLQVSDPLENIDLQKQQAQELAAFDIANAKTTGASIALLKAQLETKLLELSLNRLKAEDNAEKQRLSDLKKQYEDALREIKRIFDEETVTINLQEQGTLIDIDAELAQLERLNSEGAITETEFLERRKANRLKYIAAQEQAITDAYNREKEFIEQTVTDEKEKAREIEQATKEKDNKLKTLATERVRTETQANEDIKNSFISAIDRINEKVATFQPYISAVQDLLGSITELYRRNADERLGILQEKAAEEQELLRQQFDDQLITKQQYDNEVKASAKRLAEEERKIRKAAAEREKAIAIFNASIVGAQAILRALATPPVPNILLAGITGAAVAAQIGLIASAPLPKFAKGAKRVKGGTPGRDSVHAMVMPGEQIQPVSNVRDYAPALDMIFDRKVPHEQINRFVKMTPAARAQLLLSAGQQFKLASTTLNINKGNTIHQINDFVGKSISPKTATVKDAAGYEMTDVIRAIRKNKSTRIENVDEVAEAFASRIADNYNPRRR